MEDIHQSQEAADNLRVIRNMIESTRSSISDSSHYFLLWGWAVLAGCLAQYTLMTVFNYTHHYMAWLVTPVAAILHLFFVAKDKHKARVKTFVGHANSVLWAAIGSGFIVLSLVFVRIGWQYCFPFFILFYGLGTVISGSLIKFKPLVAGGMACFVLSAITAWLPYQQQMLSTALAILLSYIVPGHMLRRQYKKRAHLQPTTAG